MDRGSLYDEDIYAWAEQQAEALRRVAATRSDLPNELDLEHIAEEIGDVGKSELRAATSLLRGIFVHVQKTWADPGSRARGHWLGEASAFLGDLRRTYAPSMRRLIDVDEIWAEAWRSALGDLLYYGVEPRDRPTARCPFSLDELLQPHFDLDGAPARVVAER